MAFDYSNLNYNHYRRLSDMTVHHVSAATQISVPRLNEIESSCKAEKEEALALCNLYAERINNRIDSFQMSLIAIGKVRDNL